MDEAQVVTEQEQEGDGGRRLLFFVVLAVIILVVVWFLLSYFDRDGRDPGADIPATEYVLLPDVVGLTEAEASSVLADAGFLVDTLPLRDRYADEGTVLIQSPSGGTETVTGITVTIEVAEATVIEAAAVSSGETTSGLQVPDVVGRMREPAEAAIENGGFRPIVALTYDAQSPAGKVIAQYPVAGASLAFGEQVNITVSLGTASTTAVEVPDVTTMTEAGARATVEARGLTLCVVPRPSPPATLDAVWQQWPEPGSFVEPGSQVTVIIGQE